MPTNTSSRHWIALAALIATLGALVHLVAPIAGPGWYAFFGAPPPVVASARSGTWLAPASALGIALLMGLCAAYACSAIGALPRLPLLRTTLAGIAAICLLRALILVPLAVKHPELRTTFEIVAASAWGLAGIGFAAGVLGARRGAPRAPC